MDFRDGEFIAFLTKNLTEFIRIAQIKGSLDLDWAVCFDERGASVKWGRVVEKEGEIMIVVGIESEANKQEFWHESRVRLFCKAREAENCFNQNISVAY